MIRTFVEAPSFTNSLKKINDFELLQRIQKILLEDLEAGSVVEGTGGVRKIRISKSDSGKSGGYRVFYLDLKRLEITHLLIIIDKRVSENISDKAKALMRLEVQKLKERK